MPEDTSQPPSKKSEPLHAWLKLIGITLMTVIDDGEYRSLGLIYLELLDLYNRGPVKTSLVATVYSVVMMIASPAFGYLGDRFSPRCIVIVAGAMGGASLIGSCFSPDLSVIIPTYGILGSCGAAIYTNCLAELNASFDKHRGLANGIMFTGSSVGELLIPLLIQALITKYTIRGTFLILGVIRLHMCAFGMLLSGRKGGRKPSLQQRTSGHQINPYHKRLGTDQTKIRNGVIPPNDNTVTTISFIKFSDCSSAKVQEQLTPSCEKQRTIAAEPKAHTRDSAAIATKMSLRRSLLSAQFCCYVVYWILSNFGFSGITLFIPAYMDDNGFTDSQVSLALSLIGATSVVANIFLGFSIDFDRVNKRVLVVVGFIVLAVATFLLPWMLTFPLMCTYCIIAGISFSTLHLNIGPLVVDALGLENVGLGVGTFSLVFGVSSTVNPVIFSLVKESAGNYTFGFILVAISYVISAVAGLISWAHWSRIKKKQPSQSMVPIPKSERTTASAGIVNPSTSTNI